MRLLTWLTTWIPADRWAAARIAAIDAGEPLAWWPARRPEGGTG
jgi:hypothetical protein